MNEFEKKCISSCEELLQSYQFENKFHEIKGRSENYHMTEINSKGRKIEIYIYLDEAGFMIDDKQWIICERPDYSSDELLIGAFLEELKGYL